MLEKFRKHEASEAHKEVVMKLSCKKKRAQGVDDMILSQLATLQATWWVGLLKQIMSLRFLLRQGLAIRGHTEDEGNLSQLLKLQMEGSDTMQAWLGEKIHVAQHNQCAYKHIGWEVLGQILESVKSPNPSWYAIIADEAADVSNNEQFNISIRWVDDKLSIPYGKNQLALCS